MTKRVKRTELAPTEYLYGTARIRALENKLIGHAQIDALLDCQTMADTVSRLSEMGIKFPEGVKTGDNPHPDQLWEPIGASLLREAYTEIETCSPDGAMYRPFRYPYDCHNLKMAIKCRARNISADGMLFDFGTVDSDAIDGLLDTENYDVFPPAIAQGVAEARSAFARSADPAVIDRILDRACMAQMSQDFSSYADGAMLKWHVRRIDLTNCLICLRMTRVNRTEYGQTVLKDTLIPGGSIPTDTYLNAFRDACGTDDVRAREDRFFDLLLTTDLADFAKAAKAVRSGSGAVDLPRLEKLADDDRMAMVRRDAREPFGPCVLGGYLVGWETAVRNIRIILAGRSSGLDRDAIRERIRQSYV